MESKELAKLIRKDCVEMAYLSKGSHVGSALSIVDILAVLYSDIMRYNPKKPKDPKRDVFILSKGHAGSAVYSTLAHVGFFDPEILKTHYANGSILSGHVSHKKVPGIEVSTGSLGHGASIAAGMAYALKQDKKDNRVFVIVGDGECNEGQIWEMALFAAQHNLNNLTVIVDKNKWQALGRCKDVLKNENIKQKFKDFGFDAVEINGHNHKALKKALNKRSDKPICIVANTIKGKGVSFMEDELIWHYRNPDEEQYKTAIKEIEGEHRA
jgi:transketolase